ncbi:MAG: hypothetical protein ACK4IX_13855 [Candidatus Sericytochromatia bacterium]
MILILFSSGMYPDLYIKDEIKASFIISGNIYSANSKELFFKHKSNILYEFTGVIDGVYNDTDKDYIITIKTNIFNFYMICNSSNINIFSAGRLVSGIGELWFDYRELNTLSSEIDLNSSYYKFLIEKIELLKNTSSNKNNNSIEQLIKSGTIDIIEVNSTEKVNSSNFIITLNSNYIESNKKIKSITD